MKEWTRNDDIPFLEGKTIEEAYYEHKVEKETSTYEKRLVLVVDGHKHVFQAFATSYDGDCAIEYESE